MHRQLKLVVAGLSVALLAAVPTTAQIVGKSIVKGLDRVDLSQIDPVVQDVLTRDKPGSSRPWHSAESNGHVRLISGGAMAGDTCGKVRLTTNRNGTESKGYVFRFCRDATGRWRTAG